MDTLLLISSTVFPSSPSSFSPKNQPFPEPTAGHSSAKASITSKSFGVAPTSSSRCKDANYSETFSKHRFLNNKSVTAESAKFRQLLPPFLRAHAVKNYIADMDSELRQHLEDYWTGSDQVEVCPFVAKYTFALAVKLLLGVRDATELGKLAKLLWRRPCSRAVERNRLVYKRAHKPLHYLPHYTQRNHEFFPHPEKFDPSRFESAGPAPYTFVPFGGGAHLHEQTHIQRLTNFLPKDSSKHDEYCL
ncbi:hypothetical protein L1987_02602 [Smallanthus sonchifolius]|uniref:Uncharacterized protein n=1 Tax=Smallanthus sonchifolius TaxID=185202 RepID=A0ACB9K8A3_9ASTR|nr:hypothetical protein L1987_02602 [Smallanthus sonchifolius]